MAAIVISAANVELISGNANRIDANAAIAPGQIVAQDPAILALNDSVENAAITGMAITYASANSSVLVAGLNCRVAVGAVLVAGKYYALSAIAGQMFDIGDLTTGQASAICGYAESDSILNLSVLMATGVIVG